MKLRKLKREQHTTHLHPPRHPGTPAELVALGRQYQQAGNFLQAKQCLQQAIRQRPRDADLANELGTIYYALGERKKERECYERCLQLDPDHGSSLYNLANIHRANHSLDQAEQLYLRALAVNPDDADAFNNLGCLYLDQKGYAAALGQLQQALLLAPNRPDILVNHGLCLYRSGRVHEAIAQYDLALRHDPLYRAALVSKADALCCSAPATAWKEFLQFALARIDSLPERIGLSVTYAICCWLTMDFDRLATTLGELGEIMPQAAVDINGPGNLAFYLYLKGLANQAPPLDQESEPLAPLFVIGDSHALGPANREILFQGQPHRVHAHIIIGGKAWHLAMTSGNHHQAAFRAIMETIPRRAKLLLILGEIDCRSDQGIMHHHQRSKRPLADIIRQTMTGYLDYVLAAAAAKEIECIFSGVPAPDETLVNRLPAERRGGYLRMVEQVNTLLQQLARERQVSFLDVYRATVTDRKTASSQFYLDGCHLDPRFYETSIDAYLCPGDGERHPHPVVVAQ